ncbi:MAG: alpha-2-macroglobulin family protein [Chromatiales bacterium]|nr:alpha-2-macroglobulin family protein [Gammaproteobacteria bacterium]MCP5352435.1 alpha-2-macroglobulin family protein [Chromatiales bacterium]
MFRRLLALLLLLPFTTFADDLRILDIGPRTFDDAPALGVVFSAPLDPARRYEDVLIVEDAHSELVPGAWVLSDNHRVMYFPAAQPEHQYRVWARKGLPAADGARLAESVERNVTMPALTAAVGFASRGAVLPTRLGRGLPVVSVNVPRIDVDFIKVDNARLPDFLNAFRRDALTGIYELNQMKDFGRSVYRGRFELNTPRNRRTITQLPVRDLPQLREPGLYVAVMSRPGQYEYSYQTAYFFVSDLGLHTRVYPHSIGVYLSSLGDANPVSGVSVQVFDEKGAKIDAAVTDSEGKVRLAAGAGARVLVAQRGDDITFLGLNGPALDLSDNAVAGRRSRPLELFAYGPRDLYRPGEAVDVAMLLRDRDGEAVAPMPIAARLRRPDGRLVSEFTLKARELGFYQRRIPLPDNAQSGEWRLELRADPASDEPTEVYAFKVEDFLPERLRVTLRGDTGALLPPDDLRLAVDGAWLWGTPAADVSLEVTVRTRREVHPLAAMPDVFFGNPDDETRVGSEDLPPMKLDAGGVAEYAVATSQYQAGSPLAIRLINTLLEPGGRPVTRYQERVRWPAAELAGIRPLFGEGQVGENSPAAFEIVRVDTAGNGVAAPDLLVRLVREERDYYWRFDESAGWQREFSQSEYPVAQANLSFATGENGRFEAPVEWGGYRLEVVDAETGLTTMYRFNAGWWGGEARGARPDKVELSLDKPTYQAGETAKLRILPPHAGSALVLVEGSDGLLWSQRLAVPAEGAEIGIPVLPDWARHDLYVSAVVFRPVRDDEAVTPTRAVGVLPLPLARDDRRLSLAIDAPERMRPERDLELNVRTDAAAGESVALTVAAVDIGVLNISRFKTPDPFAWFFAQRGYGVDMRDLYGDIIETLDGPLAGLSYGGDTELDSAGQRAKAKPRIVALWSGVVTVGQDGSATVALPVPDFNGSLRLMAVGFGERRFGSTERDLVVAAPVIAEISTPRFLASGDHGMATLLIQNVSGVDQDLTVKLAADGPLQVEPLAESVALAAGGSKTLTVPLAAAAGVGEGRIRVAIEGNAVLEDGEPVAIQRAWPLSVRPGWPGELRRQRARLDPGESMAIEAGLSAGLMPATVRARLNVSDRPSFELADALAELLAYPYGCLEQTTSRARPLLYSAQAVELFGAEPIADADRKAWVEEAIQRVAGMQLSNGGFGLWGADGHEETWLTPFAVDFLRDAREHGFAVPAGVYDAAVERLQRSLLRRGGMVSGYSASPEHVNFASKAYAAYVLARIGKASLAPLRLLWDSHLEDAKSSLPLMHLALALDMAGDGQRAEEGIAEALTPRRPDDVYLGDYGSALRDRAMVLALLASHRPDHAAIGGLVDEVADLLAKRRWLSTQERFALLSAGLALADTHARHWFVRVAGDDRRGSGGERFALAVDGLGGAVENAGETPVYVTLDVAGFGASAPVEEASAVRIERTVYRRDGSLVAGDIAAGELVLVHLRLVARQDMEHALVADLLPAGLEIENTTLNDASAVDDFDIKELSVSEARRGTDLAHEEFRDDRYVAALSLAAEREAHLFYLARAVTRGQYIQPPPLVEDMYRPELRGIGAQSGTLMVR